MTKEAGVDPPIAEKTRLRSRQSWYLGNEAGQVEHAGCVSYTITNCSGWGYGSGVRRTPLKMLNTAVVIPIPSANATIAITLTNF
jgi:hypothetical protein